MGARQAAAALQRMRGAVALGAGRLQHGARAAVMEAAMAVWGWVR